MDSVTLYNKREFKVCGKIGHKGVDCFSLEKNKDKKEAFFKKLKKDKEKKKGQKGDIKCFKCGKTGHVKTDCPDNKEKKKEDDTGMTAVESEVAALCGENYDTIEYFRDKNYELFLRSRLNLIFELVLLFLYQFIQSTWLARPYAYIL